MDKEKLIEQLQRHEGLMLKPYKCSAGKLSIGYGRNLEANGISKSEACMLLSNDVHKCIKQCEELFCWDNLNDVRQNVLVNMCFNLGIYGLKRFKKFLGALDRKDYVVASVEMLDSLWSKQVGKRAMELSDQIRLGI
jgi:lysozyme